MKKIPKEFRSLLQELNSSPGITAREAARRLPLSHPTVSKYMAVIKGCGKDLSELVLMPDAELAELFGAFSTERFTVPDWFKMMQYAYPPGSHGRTGVKKRIDVYTNAYLKTYFPSCVRDDGCELKLVDGAPPPGCMSLSTFNRRFSAWLEQHCSCLRESRVSTTPTLNLSGPAGQIQIDGVGDRLTWRDEQGNIHQSVVMAAVSVYSTLLFAKAEPNDTKKSWVDFIESMLYALGGVPWSLKSDNGSGLARRVTVICRGKKRNFYEPHAEMQMLASYYGFEFVLTRPGNPRGKPGIERSVRTIEGMLARLPQYGGTVPARDAADLNRMIAELIDSYNDRIVPHLGISRRQFFNEYEKPFLQQPLPPEEERFSRHALPKIAVVGTRGYVRYQNCEYFLGTGLTGRTVLCREEHGKVVFDDLRTRCRYDEYQLPTDQTPHVRRFKNSRYFSPAERYVTRKLPDFLRLAERHPLLGPVLKQVYTAVFSDSALPDVDKTECCNFIDDLCSQYSCMAVPMQLALERELKKGCTSAQRFRSALIHALEGAVGKDFPGSEKTGPAPDGLRGPEYYSTIRTS